MSLGDLSVPAISYPDTGRYGQQVFGCRPARKPWAQTGDEGTSLREVMLRFPDEDACIAHIFDVRFGQGYPCPGCGRPSRWYRIRRFRRYGNNCCGGHQITPTAGCLFDRTRLPLTEWFHILLLFANSKNGLPTHFVQRHFGVTQANAHKIVDRARTHIALLEGVRRVGGPGQLVYVDEALMRGIRTEGLRGKGRAIILGMTDGRTVTTAIIPNRRTATLVKVIKERVIAGSIIVTDSLASYKRLTDHGWSRSIVNHAQNIYVNEEGISQSRIEAYWGVLKRVHRATYLHVARKNLWKYVNEFNFRYNRRHRSHETFWDMISMFPAMTYPAVPPPGLDLVMYG